MQDADIVGLATLISAEIRPTAVFSGRLNALKVNYVGGV